MPDFGFHHWLDAQLRNVPLPSDLLSRLSAGGPQPNDADARIDAALRDVSVPADLESKLRRIARPRYQPTPEWRRFALAASVFVAAGLGVGGYIALVAGWIGPQGAAVATKTEVKAPAANPRVAPKASIERPIVARSVGTQSGNVGDHRTPAIERIAVGDERPAKVEPRARVKQAPRDPAELGLPSYEQIVALGSAVRQAIDARRREQAALGAGGVLDRLPDFEVLDTLVPRRGVSPPRVKGYDLLFQLKHSEHPFVSPSAHPELAAAVMPLSMNTASYDLARRAVRAGQSPAGREIRVEDFVAAQSYLLPAAPAAGLALHAAVCPSPLGSKDLHLLQLAVQGATRRAKPQTAARLVVAVEMSWQMRAAARWEATQRALARITQLMTDADRLTLVGIAEQPRLLAQDATAREVQTLLASGKLLAPSGSADFAAGLEAASRAARAPSGGRRSPVVLLAAGQRAFEDIAPEVAKKTMTDLSGTPIPWQIVSLASQDDAHADTWANAAGGKLTTAESAASIHSVLAESLTGRSDTVANDASLKLTFNPRVVTGYRLLGHEAMTLTGQSADPVSVDMPADQAATGLYEVWIKPKGEELLASAELTWKDPTNGQPRRVVRAVHRAQLAESFSQAPPWFQQCVLAAKAAEALRGSYYAKAANPLAAVLELADQADPSVRERPEFQDLLTIVQQAERAR